MAAKELHRVEHRKAPAYDVLEAQQAAVHGVKAAATVCHCHPLAQLCTAAAAKQNAAAWPLRAALFLTEASNRDEIKKLSMLRDVSDS